MTLSSEIVGIVSFTGGYCKFIIRDGSLFMGMTGLDN